uniref:Uncharacterized protein n=1 Tax=Panagrolaimus sp. ES5 TaxID=591445 RepID=A0AC34GFJ4_9BILA
MGLNGNGDGGIKPSDIKSGNAEEPPVRAPGESAGIGLVKADNNGGQGGQGSTPIGNLYKYAINLIS